MSLESHLTELQRRHHTLSEKIADVEKSPAVDDVQLHELKRKKLLLKDEIEKLKNGHDAKAVRH